MREIGKKRLWPFPLLLTSGSLFFLLILLTSPFVRLPFLNNNVMPGKSQVSPPGSSVVSFAEEKTVDETGMEKALLAAGCFWHVEAALQDIPGVKSTTVGYTGGTTENPNYVQVCAGKTGHAEAVEVLFDPKAVSYETILHKFFDEHDASAEDAKRSTHGGQYRSEIFYYTDNQKKIAESVKAKREAQSGKKFHTEIEPVSTFTVAEGFHQDYLKIRGLKQCK
jgi:peptide-methionine (S)-S-oxide reductase